MTPLTCAVALLVSVVGVEPQAPYDTQQANGPVIVIRKKTAPFELIRDRLKTDHRTMLREDFERGVQRIRQWSAAPRQSDVRISEAFYSASLDGEFLVGEAALQVFARQPGRLPWTKCNLALTAAAWDSPDEPVLLGATAAGASTLLVSQPGRLTFDWSRRGRRRWDGEIEFDIRLPTSAVSKMQLSLPEDMQPRVRPGILVESSEESLAIVGRNEKRWTIELGGHNQMTLGIAASSRGAESKTDVLVQHSTYELSKRSVEVRSNFQIGIEHPREDLVLETDLSLYPRAVRIGDELAKWAVTDDLDSQRRYLTIPLAAAIARRLPLQVEAVRELKIGEAWSLPRWRVVDGVWWQETADLLLPHTLELNQLDLTGGRQADVQARGGPTQSNRYHLRFDAPDAEVRVAVSHQSSRFDAMQLDSVLLGEAAPTAVTTLLIEAQRGSLFDVDAQVLGTWLIDTVESEPRELVDQWTIEDDGALNVSFARPVNAGQQVRLLIRTRRQPLANPTFSGTDLQPVRFLGVKRRWMSVQTSEPYELQAEDGPNVEWFQPEEIPQALIDESLASSAWLFSARGPGPQLTMQKGPAERFSATVEIEALLQGSTLVEKYRVRCNPASAPLNRLRMTFSQPRDQDVAWMIEGQEEPLEVQWLQAPGSSSHKAMRIELPRPTSESFTLRAEYRSSVKDVEPVALVWLNDATEQASVVRVGSDNGSPLKVETSLDRVPARQRDLNLYRDHRASYSYVAARDVQDQTPLLAVGPGKSTRGDSAWVFDSSLESRFAMYGESLHGITYQIVSGGQRTVDIDLPSDSAVRRALVNGVSQSIQTEGSRLRVMLPDRERYVILRIEYARLGGHLPAMGELESDFPQITLPTLQTRWRVWLPPGYQPVAASAHLRPEEDALGRLAGPFRSRPYENVFWLAPLRLWSMLTGQKTHSAVVPDDAKRLLTNLGRSQSTWAALGQVEGENGDRSTLIDTHALTGSSIAPDRELPSSDVSDPYRRGIKLLQSEQLMLLVGSRGLLLTTTERAAAFSRQINPTPVAAIGVVRPGLLDHWISATVDGLVTPFVTVADWPTLTRPNVFQTERATNSNELLQTGWTLHHVQVPAQSSLSIYRPSSFRILAYVAYLSSIVLLRPLTLGRNHGAVAAIVCFGTASMFVPEPLTVIATACFWGAMTCLLLNVVRFRARSLPRRLAAPATLCAILAFPAGVLGQPDATDVSSAKTFSVLVPEDDSPAAADAVFVPAELYDWIQRTLASLDHQPSSLITSANYRALLPSTDEPSSMPIVAEYHVRTFQRNTIVRFPRTAGLQVDEVKLDGWPIDTSLGESAIDIRIGEPGKHRLRLSLNPTVDGQGEHNEVTIRIPAVADSQLQLSIPPHVQQVEIPSARGVVSRRARRVDVQLGQTDSLSVLWPNRRAAPASYVVDRLTTLRARPSGVFVDTYLRLEGPRSNESRRLRFVIPAGLVLHKVIGDEVEHFELPDGRQEINIEVANWHLQPSLELQFKLRDHPGVGRMAVPEIEVENATLRSDYVAIKADRSLTLQVNERGDHRAVSPTQLPQGLPNVSEMDRIFELNPRGSRLVVQTQFSESDFVVETDFRAEFTANQVEYIFAVDFEDIQQIELTAMPLQFQVQSPDDWPLTEALILTEQGPIDVDVTKGPGGILNLFLPGRTSRPTRLEMRGSRALNVDEAVDLPRYAVAGVDVRAHRVHLYRDPSARLIAEETAQFMDDDRDFPTVENDRSLHFASFVQTELTDSPPLRVSVSPNLLEFDGDLYTTLTREAGGWLVQLWLDTKVRSGILDQVRFELPATWSNRLISERALPITYSRSPNPGRVYMTVRLPRSIEEQTERLSFHTSLIGSDSHPFVIPNVTVVGVKNLSRHVLLPTREVNRLIEWPLQNLGPPNPNHTSQLSDRVSDELQAYELIGDDFETLRGATRSVRSDPRIRLCDVRVSWRGDRFQGDAVFDIDPATLDSCVLALPEDSRLVHIGLDDAPALTEPLRDGNRKIQLGPRQAPQRLRVFYVGKVRAASRGSIKIDAPILRDARMRALQVDQTLWTIEPMEGVDEVTWVGNVLPIHEADGSVIRAKAIARLIERTGDMQFDDQAKLDWYLPWLRRMNTAISDAKTHLPRVDETIATRISAQLDHIEKRQATIADGIGVPRDDVAGIEETQSAMHPSSALTRHFMSPGDMSQATIKVRLQHGKSLQVRAGLAVGFLLLAGFALHPGTRHLMDESIRRWLLGFTVVAGIAWCLWLSPGIIGLVIVALALCATYRASIRWNRISPEAMT